MYLDSTPKIRPPKLIRGGIPVSIRVSAQAAQGGFARCLSLECLSRDPLLRADLMEGDSAGPSRKPSSQSQHAIYKLEMMFPMQEGKSILDDLRTGARTLLGRDVMGGTENPLRALVAIGSLTASRGAKALTAAPSAAASTGDPFCTIAVLAAPVPQQPVAPISLALITLIIIYDGAGRLKASVKRSLKTLLAGSQGAATFSAALQVLEAWSAASAMSFVDEHPSNVVKVEWRGGVERDLIDYLKERVATDNQTPLMRTSNSALLACSGLDVLGPHSRKRPLMLADKTHQPSSPRGGSSSSALLASPTKLSSAPSARPPDEALATLLSWSDELTAEEATRRANGLLELIQKTMEENAVYKIANAGTLDSRKVRARASLPSCPLSCLQLS